MTSNALVLQEPFFAPMDGAVLNTLFDQYSTERTKIEAVSRFVTSDCRSALRYFLEGNRREDRLTPDVDHTFNQAGAIAELNSDYWRRALDLTDALSCMTQKRRDDWFTAIRERKTPEFNEDSVIPTIQELLLSRGKYFAERVDGIFRALSPHHVTNSPMGFGTRFILSNVFSAYDTVNSSQAGYINDLRVIIAKFMGRDEPRWSATSRDLDTIKRLRGQWQVMDGGALRIRVYKVGTAHLEIHPSMAWRLNAVLASLHPSAIPHRYRTEPKTARKSFAVMSRPLPFAVLEILRQLRSYSTTRGHRPPPGHHTYSIDYEFRREHRVARAEAVQILESLGGVRDRDEDEFTFDYLADSVIDQIVMTGCMPDQKSYQFYPTPPTIAAEVIAAAEIPDEGECLEPSAGRGALAELMPRARLTCVELSSLHCAVLKAKGFATVHQADFLAWAESTRSRYVRICANPPFSENRWFTHTAAAAKLLVPGGRLVAVLPASARGKAIVSGWPHRWSEPMIGEFKDTGVSVVIVTLDRPVD